MNKEKNKTDLPFCSTCDVQLTHKDEIVEKKIFKNGELHCIELFHKSCSTNQTGDKQMDSNNGNSVYLLVNFKTKEILVFAYDDEESIDKFLSNYAKNGGSRNDFEKHYKLIAGFDGGSFCLFDKSEKRIEAKNALIELGINKNKAKKIVSGEIPNLLIV